jgi:hypothetical protein
MPRWLRRELGIPNALQTRLVHDLAVGLAIGAGCGLAVALAAMMIPPALVLAAPALSLAEALGIIKLDDPSHGFDQGFVVALFMSNGVLYAMVGLVLGFVCWLCRDRDASPRDR